MTFLVHHRPFWDRFAGHPADVMEAAHRSWGWLFGFGVLTLLIGIFAIIYTEVATITTVLFIGWILIIGGIFQIVAAFYARHWSGVILDIAAGVLGFFMGLLLITHPGLGAAALTLLMAAYFLISGTVRILASLFMWFEHWGWSLLNGIVTLALGILIWSRWPISAFWILGLFVGIDLILAGSTLISIALVARQINARPSAPAY